jgi:hypothetical protein
MLWYEFFVRRITDPVCRRLLLHLLQVSVLVTDIAHVNVELAVMAYTIENVLCRAQTDALRARFVRRERKFGLVSGEFWGFDTVGGVGLLLALSCPILVIF